MKFDNELKTKVVQVRDDILSVMSRMKECKTKYGDNLPPYDVGFDIANSLLTKPDFTIVVSGETNRGKSTFINAIIGQKILPIYDRETTSQVFKITNAKEESFYVVFDNGDTKTIDKSDLAKIGSQVEANKGDALDFGDKRISYIQINTPIKFLPDGITVVDTPGLDSTYKHHSEITKGFMQYADAVIYLCSAKHPLGTTDIDFIRNHILSLSSVPSIMVVMSKADEADDVEALKDLIERCEKILQENFPENQFVNKSVFPVISANLIRSTNTNTGKERSQEYYESSYFEQIKDEIQSLILKTKGIIWTMGAYNECVRYYKKTSNAISQQIELYNQTVSYRQSALDTIEANKAKFIATMGPARRNEILTEVNQILNAVPKTMVDKCDLNGEIYKKYLKEIDANISINTTQDEVDKYAAMWRENILTDITDIWSNLCSHANNEIAVLLQKYSDDCDEFVAQTYTISSVNTSDVNIAPVSTMREIRSQYFNASFVCNMTAFLGSLLFGPIGVAVWVLLNIGPILYAVIFGRQAAKQKKYEKLKSDLIKYIKDVIQGAERELFKVSVFEGKYTSVINAFVTSMHQFAERSLIEAYNRSEAELQANSAKVKATIGQLDPNKKTILVDIQKSWNDIAEKLKSYTDIIKELNELISQ
jgi:GTPase Era involved in 16S rRNA processing